MIRFKENIPRFLYSMFVKAQTCIQAVKVMNNVFFNTVIEKKNFMNVKEVYRKINSFELKHFSFSLCSELRLKRGPKLITKWC